MVIAETQTQDGTEMVAKTQRISILVAGLCTLVAAGFMGIGNSGRSLAATSSSASSAAAVNKPAAGNPPTANQTTSNSAWNKVCGNDGVCYVEQYALVMPQKTPVLNVRFDLQGGEGRARIFIKTPLGVTLRNGGLSFVIDGHEPVVLPYDRCLSTGCVAWAVLANDSLDTFKKGNALKVIYYFPEGADPAKVAPRQIPIELTGLAAALATLAK